MAVQFAPLEKLKDVGFDSEQLSSIEEKLGKCFRLRIRFLTSMIEVISAWSVLGITADQLDDPFFDTLGFLGFSPEKLRLLMISFSDLIRLRVLRV